MKIVFPKKYRVEHIIGPIFYVHIPADSKDELIALLNAQDWVKIASQSLLDWIDVVISQAFEITTAQAIAALSQLCEHVMESEIDMEVWGALDES